MKGCVTVTVLVSVAAVSAAVAAGHPACAVFCSGPILETIQSRNVYPDCKTFVDQPLRINPQDAVGIFTSQGLQ